MLGGYGSHEAAQGLVVDPAGLAFTLCKGQADQGAQPPVLRASDLGSIIAVCGSEHAEA